MMRPWMMWPDPREGGLKLWWDRLGQDCRGRWPGIFDVVPMCRARWALGFFPRRCCDYSLPSCGPGSVRIGQGWFVLGSQNPWDWWSRSRMFRDTSLRESSSRHRLQLLSTYFWTFMEPRNWFQGMNSASLCSLAGGYDNPIPTRSLAPIDCLKIPALHATVWFDTKEIAILTKVQRLRRRLGSTEKEPKNHLMTVCLYQVMKVGLGRESGVWVLLCMWSI